MTSARLGLLWAASHAERPRSSETTTPSCPVIKARIRPTGSPLSTRSAKYLAARNSAIWR